jgi:Glycosyl transferases group 1
MDDVSLPDSPIARRFGRILEVGEHCLIGRALPSRTDYVCTHLSRALGSLPSDLRQLEPMAAIRALRAGSYGLVIAHAPAYAGLRASILRFAVQRPFRRMPILALRSNLARLVPRHIPVIMLDLEDAPIVYANNLALLDRALLCYKRELPADRARVFMQARAPALPEAAPRLGQAMVARLAKLRPISTGLSDAVLAEVPQQPVAKTADIFFAGRIAGSSTLRQSGSVELIQLASRGVKVDFATQRLALPDFLKHAAAARLVWSPEGYAHECFRHLEAAACWSVPVINTPGIERHKPLRQGIHALYYNVEPGGLTKAVMEGLRQPERLSKMSRAAHRHALRHHSAAALTRHILGEVAALLDGSPARG